MTSLLNEAQLLGYKIYQDPNNHYLWTIEIPLGKGQLILQERGLGRWLLISNKTPQIWLIGKKTSEFLKQLNRKFKQ